MKRFKIIPLTFLLTLLAISLTNTSVVLSGYETDPTGDADGIIGCDITQINVDVDYNSPEDDEIILKITLAAALELNTSITYNWFDYNFYVDTSLSTNSNTSLLTDDIYEYRAHLGRKHNNNTGIWTNTSSLLCTRYYYTGDGQGKTLGSFYWNPNTENWVGSDPGIDFGEVIGNTIVWDVTGAIYRELELFTENNQLVVDTSFKESVQQHMVSLLEIALQKVVGSMNSTIYVNIHLVQVQVHLHSHSQHQDLSLALHS